MTIRKFVEEYAGEVNYLRDNCTRYGFYRLLEDLEKDFDCELEDIFKNINYKYVGYLIRKYWGI